MARALKLGLNTGYWAGGPPPGIAGTIAEAERLGFDSMWTAEAYGSDCLTPLAWWGAATERIRFGTAIVHFSPEHEDLYRVPLQVTTLLVSGDAATLRTAAELVLE